MSGGVFRESYARSYDAIYAEKDYEGECDFIEESFRRQARGAVRSVLDLGCGTGNHAIPLARRGYRVMGVDRSPAMIEVARGKSAAGLNLEWVVADIRGLRLPGTYDAALLMFAVLSYQTGNADVCAVLETARRHLRPGGVLVFDVWYGPAVLQQRPEERIRVIQADSGEIIRVVTPTLHTERDVVDVRIRLWRLRDGRVEETADEVHPMRFFFLPELVHLLAGAGFDLASSTSFPKLDVPPEASTWNLGCVAIARER